MRKIRILTFWGVPNHGCFLQAYALQKVIQSLCPDDDVRQTAYLGKKHYNFYYNSTFDRRKILRLKKEHELKKYIKYYYLIPHTNNKRITSFPNEEMDILVLGSDIIWDYNSELLYGDEYLFGGGVSAKRKISYAPSFGRGNTEILTPDYVKKCLKDLDAISVRDQSSYDMVVQLTDREPEIVLDPTLLYDFSKDECIVKPKEERPYIVVYGSDFAAEQIDSLRAYAESNDLLIINLEFMGKKYSWCNKTIGRDELSPFEWMGYFRYASFVMTSTFHGLVFGLIFERNLIFNPTDFIMKKASKLLNDLGVSEMLLHDHQFEKAENGLDYSVIRKRFDELRRQSVKYLTDSLTV